jgi:hypothetical protein
VIFGPDDP